MDITTFDAISRQFGNALDRRKAVRSLGIGAAILTAGSITLPADDAAATRRHKKRRKHHKERCARHGDGCGAIDENREYTAPYCCHPYTCMYGSRNGSSSWTCQVAP
jgi:hypothetical protein